MNGQGNLTQLLTGSDDVFEFDGTTVYDTIMKEDDTEYNGNQQKSSHSLWG